MIIQAKRNRTAIGLIMSHKVIMGIILAWIVMMIVAGPAMAEVPTKHFEKLNGKPVIDAAEVIDKETESSLNQKLISFAETNGRQMVVITVESLHGYDIETFTLDYARHLGIGSKELDDGIVFLVAPNERKMRLEVGYGLEWYMTDAKASMTIDIAKPYFREENYAGGIVAVVDAVLPEITPEAEQRAADEKARNAEQRKKSAQAFWNFLEYAGMILGAIAMAIGAWFVSTIPSRRRKKQQERYEDLLSLSRMAPEKAFREIQRISDREARGIYGANFDREEIVLNAIKRNGRLIDEIGKPNEAMRMAALDSYPEAVLSYENPTEKEQDKALERKPELLTRIQNPTTKQINAALRSDGSLLRHVARPTEEQIRIAVSSYPEAVFYLDDPSPSLIIMALVKDGLLIGKVKNPTKEMRKAAITQNPHAISQIDNPTSDEDLLAIDRDPEVIRYMAKRATRQYWVTAIGRDGTMVRYCKDPDETLQIAAIRQNVGAIRYIARPSDKAQALAIRINPDIATEIENPNKATQKVADAIQRERALARAKREEEERRKREKERKRAEEEAAERKRREEERRRRESYSSSSSSSTFGSSFGGSSFGSSDSGSSGFSGGGGSFGGGGASGDW